MGFNIGKIGRTVGAVAGGRLGGIGGAIAGGAAGGFVANNHPLFAMLGKKGGPTGFSAGGVPQFAMKNTSDFITNDTAPKIGGDGSAMARRYSNMRERVSQDANTNLQNTQHLLERKFASIGAGGSGSAIKMGVQANEASDRQRADAVQNINDQEALAGENKDLAQSDLDFKQKVFNFERGSKLHELDMAERQQQIDASSTEFNKRMAQFQAQPPKQGLLSNLLGGIL